MSDFFSFVFFLNFLVSLFFFNLTNLFCSIVSYILFINLSFYSLSLDDISDRLKIYFNKRIPSKIIIGFPPSSMALYRLQSNKIPLPTNSNFFFLKLIKREFSNLDKYWKSFIVQNILKLKNFETIHWNYGGGTKFEKWINQDIDKRYKDAKMRVEMQTPNFSLSERQIINLKETINILKKKNTKLVVCLVVAPHSKEYYGYALQQKNYQLFFDFAKKFAEQNNLKFLNYFDIFSEKQYFFADQEHLNSLGQDYFTKMILEECF